MLLIQVYKSSRKEESYLYVEKSRGLEDVPEALMQQFGEPEKVMLLSLTADKKLARVNAVEVIADIERQGFFLQMPPTLAQLMARDSSRD
ncbi:MAG: hypothetical protein ACI9JM_000929 [Halioglobus sp.]|jgi:uncharacterized protein YcgL (UPF0745 family)